MINQESREILRAIQNYLGTHAKHPQRKHTASNPIPIFAA